MVLAVGQVISPSPHHVAVQLSQSRIVAGETASGEIRVRNRRGRRSGSGVIELPVGIGRGRFFVPPLRARAEWNEVFSVATRRRGVITVGPAQAVRSDALELLRRVRVWDRPGELHVHPRTIRLPFDATGFQADIEGVTTAKLSSSDVSFHALRDYIPGDDRRNVHWVTTARLGRLIVRQFEETRRSHHLIVLDATAGAWAGDDFEVAVSAAASLALAGLGAARTVSFTTTQGWVPTTTPVRMLDALTELELGPGEPLASRVARALAERPGISVLTVVVGPTVTDEQAAQLANLSGVDVRCGILRVVLGVQTRRRHVGGGTLAECAELAELPRLVLGGGLS